MVDEDLNRDIIVCMRDIRAAKMCSKGTRQFFRDHKLDWQAFLKNGIKAGELIDTKDEMAMQVVRCANGRT